MNTPNYSAVVLDPESRLKALALANEHFPNIIEQAGWEPVAHHCTIKMGGLAEDQKKFLGDSAHLIIDGVGVSLKVIALRVKKNSFVGKLSSNDIPHITVGVHRQAGGKPFDSNKITDWTDIEPVYLEGEVEEIYK
jgi:hypothetical protein